MENISDYLSKYAKARGLKVRRLWNRFWVTVPDHQWVMPDCPSTSWASAVINYHDNWHRAEYSADGDVPCPTCGDSGDCPKCHANSPEHF